MAIKFEKIVAGMRLYDLHSERMGSTTMRSMGVWFVDVLEVDVAQRRALVSWNGNKPEWKSAHTLTRYRAKRPELVTNGMGQQRLKRKGEP